MDVARCLAETNLVNGDLLPILSTCSDNEQGSKHKSRVALACCKIPIALSFRRRPLTSNSGIVGPIDMAGGASWPNDRQPP